MLRRRSRSAWDFARTLGPIATLATFAACSGDASASSIDTSSAFQRDLEAAGMPGAPTRPTAPLPGECVAENALARSKAVHAIDSARAVWTAEHGLKAERLGDGRDAKALLEISGRLDPRNAAVAYHLGRVSERLRERDAAVHAYCRYLAIDPASSTAAEVAARIHQLEPARTARVSVAPAPRRVITSPAHLVPRAGRRTQLTRVDLNEAASTTRSSNDGAIAPPSNQASAAPVPTSVEQQAPTAGSRPTSTVPAAPPGSGSQGIMTRDAVWGAGVGAVFGAAVGRNGRSAAIGGVVGGVLGAIVGGRARP